jgi:hypothetical protein
MRNPGENAGGRGPGRRRSPSGRAASPRQGPAPSEPGTGGTGARGTGARGTGARGTEAGAGRTGAGERAAREPSLFAPGYSGGRSARRDATPAGGARGDGGQHGTGQYGAGLHKASLYGVGQYRPDPYGAGQYGSAGGAAGKGPIRGFPPAPGQPPPLYPPGPFSAWNRAAWPGDNGYADPGVTGPDSGAWPAADRGTRESAGPGPAGPGDAEPGYPSPAYADDDVGYAHAGHPDAGYAEPDYSALAVSDPSADVTSTQTWGVVDDDAPAASGWPDLGASGERGRHPDSYSGRMPAGAEYDADLAAPDQAARRQAAPGDALAGWAAPGQTAPGEFGPAAPSELGQTAPGEFGRAGPGGAAPGLAAPRRAEQDGRDDTLRAGGPRGAPRRAADGLDTGARPTQEPARRQGTRGHGSRGRSRPKGRKRRSRILLAVALAVAVVAGAAGYLWFAGRHPAAPAAAPPRATPDPSPSPPTTLGVWGHIASRASDRAPLTLAELFPARFADGGISYTRTVQKARTHCAGALIGSALASAVSHAGCTQVMRASYLSSGSKLMGTIGVLNLSTATAAERAGKAAGPSEFIAQLPAARGLTKRLTQGTGIEAAEVKGHYLVLVWAEFANLHAPKSAAQRRELEAFVSVLIQKTANVSLASRMITGRPAL